MVADSPNQAISLLQPCPSEEIYGEHAEEAAFLKYFRDNLLNSTHGGQELIKLLLPMESSNS